MEKNLLLSIIHASEDIDIFAVKIKKDLSIEKCKLYLTECLKSSNTIESFLIDNLELSDNKPIIDEIISDIKSAYNSKSISEIHSKMRNCISSNSTIYANLIELYEK